MIIESNLSILYSDTPVPEVFITEYMPSMDCRFVKVYIYCVFLSKHGKNVTADDLSKKLELELEVVKAALTCFESLGMIVRNDSRIQLTDLKEKEIKKLYRLKSTSSPDDVALSTDRNKKRIAVIRDINNKYFQGVMSPTWYTDIDAWFDKYGFEEDVMFALFEHCYLHKGLTKPYMSKVADNWKSKNIKNGFDLDNFSMEQQKLRDIRQKIQKKLRMQRMLTEYEEAYVDRWVTEYGFDFEIIELALKKTTSSTSPNFEYINKIVTEWHLSGLTSKDTILEYEKARKQMKSQTPGQGQAQGKGREPNVPQKGNFDQRKYDDEFFDKLYKEV
ncbi:MAG: DnaD domain protein [Clostridiales bacterium]|nr:DnaD domain protein [Clostridiales bacterium]